VKSKVTQLVVKNNGQAFREEDWQRLKRIAEGNPDEQKIGGTSLCCSATLGRGAEMYYSTLPCRPGSSWRHVMANL
jgi:hypothetical protein